MNNDKVRIRKYLFQQPSYRLGMGGILPLAHPYQRPTFPTYKELLQNAQKPNGNPQGYQRSTQMPQMPQMQTGGLIEQGYKDDSPYRHLEQIEIPGNNITMDNVSMPLLLIPDVGPPQLAPPNSGNYTFPGASRVLEIPQAQKGITVEKDEAQENWNRIDAKVKEIGADRFRQKHKAAWDWYYEQAPTLGHDLPEYQSQVSKDIDFLGQEAITAGAELPRALVTEGVRAVGALNPYNTNMNISDLSLRDTHVEDGYEYSNYSKASDYIDGASGKILDFASNPYNWDVSKAGAKIVSPIAKGIAKGIGKGGKKFIQGLDITEALLQTRKGEELLSGLSPMKRQALRGLGFGVEYLLGETASNSIDSLARNNERQEFLNSLTEDQISSLKEIYGDEDDIFTAYKELREFQPNLPVEDWIESTTNYQQGGTVSDLETAWKTILKI